MARFLYILLVVLLFGVLIAIHEFGHFFTAKLLGVKVNEFAIGMGPAVWQSRKGSGEPWEEGRTLYSLRLFPIGGYCAMEGEDEDTGDPRAFSRQAGWKKVIILCAGSFMNFVLGLVILVVLSLGRTEINVPVITAFMDGFALEGESGLMAGDRILSVDGHSVWLYEDALTYLDRNDGQGVDLVVERNGQRIVLDNFPMTRSIETVEGGQTVKKFGLYFQQTEPLTILGRIRLGSLQAVDFVRIVWMSLGDLVTGQVPVSELSGVVGVVDVVSEVGAVSQSAAIGIYNVFSFMALIAVNLAVMNMLPIPALDGGRIFFVLLNGLTYLVARRRIPEKYEGYVHAGAFVVLLALMAVVALHDVWNIFA